MSASACSPTKDRAPQGTLATTSAALNESTLISEKAAALGTTITGAAIGGVTTETSPSTGNYAQIFTYAYQRYANGAILASDAHGAYWMTQAMLDYWRGLANVLDYYNVNVLSIVGPPIDAATLVGGQKSARFERGIIFDQYGVQVVYGGMYDRFKATEAVALVENWPGFPTGPEVAVPGGRSQPFTLGSLEWRYAPVPVLPNQVATKQDVTAVEVLNGPIRDAWLASGGRTGTWGWPTDPPRVLTDALGVVRGNSQQFQNGGLYYKSGAASAMGVGYPFNAEYCTYGGPVGFPGLFPNDPKTSSPNKVQELPLRGAHPSILLRHPGRTQSRLGVMFESGRRLGVRDRAPSVPLDQYQAGVPDGARSPGAQCR